MTGRDLIAAADDGRLTYSDGWFVLDGVLLDGEPGLQARELVFAGMLLVRSQQVTATADGRQLLAGAR